MRRLPLLMAVAILFVMIPVAAATAFTLAVNNSPPVAGIISNSSNSSETVQISATALTSPPAGITGEAVQITATNEGTAVNVGHTSLMLANDNVTLTVDNVMAQSANAVTSGEAPSINFTATCVADKTTAEGAITLGVNTQANTQAQARIQVGAGTTSMVSMANYLLIDTAKTATLIANNTDKNAVNNSEATNVIQTMARNNSMPMTVVADNTFDYVVNTSKGNVTWATVRTNSLQVTALGHNSYYTVNYSFDGTCVSSGKCVAGAAANLKEPIFLAAAGDDTFSVTSLSAEKVQEGRAYAKSLVLDAEGFDLNGVTNSITGNTDLEIAVAGNTPNVYALNTSDAMTRAATPIHTDITMGIVGDGLAALNFA